MARRRHHEEHENHEAWAIPYGDLITLLLAFFVVMYALSSVNEGKYRVLSDSLVAAFRGAPRSLEPVQVGELQRAFSDVQVERTRTLVPLETDQMLANMRERRAEVDEDFDWAALRQAGLSAEEIDEAVTEMEALGEEMAEELKTLVDENLVRLRQSRFWLEIEINTSVLFPTASASLSSAAQPVVGRIGEILSDTSTLVQVEGHTDTIPIATASYPSNWELSAARAATVVRILTTAGVDPIRMSAVGFGEYRPVAENDTIEGRSRNRRVAIVVTAAGESSEEIIGDSVNNDVTGGDIEEQPQEQSQDEPLTAQSAQ